MTDLTSKQNLVTNVRMVPSLRLAQTPWIARQIGYVMVLMVFLIVIGLFLPWQQSIHGSGRAVAFNPTQRPQQVVAPIEGRLKKWYVVEGDRVKAGQRIVELIDNDPNLELRLLDEERATIDRLRAAESRVVEMESRIRNLGNSRDLAISIASLVLNQERARLDSFEQDLLEAQAALDAAEPNYKRQKELFENDKGSLASKRDLELATQALETAKAKRKSAMARVTLAKAGVTAAMENQKKIDSDTAAMINSETAALRSAQSEVAAVRRDKAQIEVRIAKQRAQYIDSPVNGTLFRLLANAEEGGLLVRPGQTLAIIVPDVSARGYTDLMPTAEAFAEAATLITSGASGGSPVALASQADVFTESGRHPLTGREYPGIVTELYIDGNDLPLVKKGDRVRLQFEGWPAVQFVGWPSVAVGTFGGIVYLVDPTTNDKGQFRLLVEPDPADMPWPDERYLRQGVRAQGWTLLQRVPVWWELWRNLNGFPPTRDQPEPKGGKSMGPVKSTGLK